MPQRSRDLERSEGDSGGGRSQDGIAKLLMTFRPKLTPLTSNETLELRRQLRELPGVTELRRVQATLDDRLRTLFGRLETAVAAKRLVGEESIDPNEETGSDFTPEDTNLLMISSEVWSELERRHELNRRDARARVDDLAWIQGLLRDQATDHAGDHRSARPF